MEKLGRESNQNNKSKAGERIMWPSARLPQGGMFHAAKFEYSKETADFVKLLMEESKMTMMMRNKINYHLRNGEPLPKPKPIISKLSNDTNRDIIDILEKARNAKRKSLAAIRASGAYDMPVYRPRPNDKIPTDKAKKLLQERMCGMPLSDTTMKIKRKRNLTKTKPLTKEDLINELMEQINERAEWLSQMEELGEGRKYRDEIREQIAERLREIKTLEAKSTLEKEGIRYLE